MSQQRLRGVPQIQIRIELAADTLDLQQGFLDQQHLRRILRVECA